jgi:glycosyltransferase involved in cell wall biosynthesis
MIMSYKDFKDKFNKSIHSFYEGKKIKVLDVGAGNGLYGTMLKDIAERIDAVEAHAPYIESFKLEKIYDNVYNIDICDFELPIKYDLIIFGDILEHIEADKAIALLDRLKDIEQIIIAVPYNYEQGAINGNPYEVHKQPDLTKDIFLQRYPNYSYMFGDNKYGYFAKDKEINKHHKPTLHMISLFHTIPNHDYDHCAFTGKVLRFSKMMKKFGYEIIEYSNGESISEADMKVQILTKEELMDFVDPPTSLKALHGVINTPVHKAFHDRLVLKMKKFIKPNDIILHPYGMSHKELVTLYPECFHVESGVGYVGEDFGAIRIFDSYTWMHYLLGNHIHRDQNGNAIMENGNPKVGKSPSAYTFAVPNYLDTNEWPAKETEGDYFLYVGRIIEEKGLYILKEIAARLNEPVKIAGLGNTDQFEGLNMEFIGPVTGVENKSNLFKNAKALFVPSQYVEPFGIVIIEAMMSGTPVITSDFGAFVELVEHGKTGFRCRTLADYMAATKAVLNLDRKYIAERARELYTYDVVGKRYDEIFKQIYDLRDRGWYTDESYYIK